MKGIDSKQALLAIEEVFPDYAGKIARREGDRIWSIQSTCRKEYFIVKLYNKDNSGFMREVKTLQEICRNGLAFEVPVLHRYGILPCISKAFVIMSELKGLTLDSMIQKQRCERKAAFFLIGRALSEFHKLIPPQSIRQDKPSVRDSLIATCENHIYILEEHGEIKVATLARSVKRFFERNTTFNRVVFCHGDLHLKNMMAEFHHDILSIPPKIIDFESVRVETPEFDVAKSIVVCGAMYTHDIDAIFAGYGDGMLDEDLLSNYQAFHAIDGWLYGNLLEHRDCALWNQRLLRYASHR